MQSFTVLLNNWHFGPTCFRRGRKIGGESLSLGLPPQAITASNDRPMGQALSN